ncbi:dienelactone hydrolase family protein [Sphingobium phenoxybenzoativorans]|uniref:dienelactone hydrolase family protein n=1 Tax=Sphingobium phenoxybenzoativorans TaxID=1592790 RepID=UPI00087319E1|nr:dienelactone hydrolase family protein [Sphingobium phenoxybenzoativorans]
MTADRMPENQLPESRAPADRLPEDQNWVQMLGVDRRSLLIGGAFAAGFAAACQPVAATTVQTPSDGLSIENVHFTGSDGFAVPAYVARPDHGKPAPIIVVVHEIFGVHEWMKDMCRRFAKAGYYAVAPDLFARQGDATKVSEVKTLMETIVSKAPDAQVMADIDAAFAWAGAHGGDGGKRGITGFCWGGRIVWLYAAHSQALDAGVAFYGRLTGDPKPLQPKSPVELADALHAPVLGQYGGQDKGIPVGDVDAMREKLKAAGKPGAITVYPDAGHGFMADYRPSYDPAAAAAAWKATADWFGKYVKKG